VTGGVRSTSRPRRCLVKIVAASRDERGPVDIAAAATNQK
jgi:hypothetical protein